MTFALQRSKNSTPAEAGVYLLFRKRNVSNWVYFDDLKVTHTKTNVVQYNEYYPFGLSASTSWTREGSKNDFLFNGGNELNSVNGWYEMLFRGYDPALGRMLQVDPMASQYASWSPYNFSFNNPVSWNDPLGAENKNALEFVMDLFNSVPDGENRTFNAKGEILEKEADGGGGGDGYSPGAASDYPVFAIVSNPYGTWYNMGPYWVDISTDQQKQKRSRYEKAQQGGACPFCLNSNTVGQNIAGMTYPGGDNPRSYNGRYNYSYVPTNLAEYPAIGHDRRYDKLGISGLSGLLGDTRAIGADWKFVYEELEIASNQFLNPIDRLSGLGLGIGLGFAASIKTVFQIMEGPIGGIETMVWYNISNEGVSNSPNIHQH